MTKKVTSFFNLQIDVYPSDGVLFEGQVSASDFHYNVATITIRSSAPLPIAILRHFDDSMVANPFALCNPDNKTFKFIHHVDKGDESSLFKLGPGDRVVALGRHYSSGLMAALGQFWYTNKVTFLAF
ncbi:LOW QUALITY PROTEIN: hypothetical protein CFOL_v3_22032 [Cephalotus follicularis]|uniref:Uncharacterized protein n=1 Tax=Cephalotus follicularis TaxID=3775 RepID=A0A1Q3CEA3_CEPFO|nr:LOW QUALITY PROTEIN: hypothetical protein CFOL_v3_22032 [Cephalotus follicularis]